MENVELRKRESAKICLIRQIRVPILIAIMQLCSNAFAQQKQETFTIINYFTARYRDFPMMKISIIPPEGFAKDTDQSGFLDLKNTAAIRADEIKQSIDTSATIFFKLFDSTGRNDSLGMKLLETYNFKINGYQAHLINISGRVEGEDYLQWWIFIGDSSDTYIIKSFIPLAKKKILEQRIRTALLSVFYEPDRRLIPIGVDPTTTSSSACNCHNKK